LTDARVKALRPEAARYSVLDVKTPGLSVQVTPKGAKSWYYTKRVHGRFERVRIGSVAELSVDKARTRAGGFIGAVSEGRSPTEERRAVRAEMTLGELWALYAEQRGPAKRSFATDERRFKHLAPLATRRLSTIEQSDVNALLDDITTNSGKIASNRVRALARMLFNFARGRGVKLANPVVGTLHHRENAKTRYLSPEELGRFLAAVDADGDADLQDYLRLLVFTGVRRGTLCRARWADLDIPGKLWRIPAEYMKAGRPLEIPLAPEAAAIFAERQRLAAPEAVWVFPGRTPTGHRAGSRVGWLRVLARAEIAGVTEHDLRRSFATYALEARVQWPIIAALLGHTKPAGATAIYAQPTMPELRAAVEATVTRILTVAGGGGTVLAFPAAEVAK
jgi:integrase